MKEFILSLFIIISIPSCLNGLNMEERVAELEKQLGGLESLVTHIFENEFEDSFHLERRCPLPEVEHGKVECDREDRVPGTQCRVECSLGCIATPGVTCLEGGRTWSGQLRCDVPLLVVSGGSINPSVEVIDFHNGTGCDLNIPDIPKSKHGEVRLMHNMFYFPGSPFQLLVCNGLSQSSKASCDSWTLGDSKWKHHSYPNMDQRQQENDELLDWEGWKSKPNFTERMYHLARSGLYAASSYSWNGNHYIVGGMHNEGKDHKQTNSIREYMGPSNLNKGKLVWKESDNQLKKRRALFCIAQYNVSNFAAIGGLSGYVERSVELLRGSGNIPEMRRGTNRNGHACAGFLGNASNILVSGGAANPHHFVNEYTGAKAKALNTSEMYSSDTNSWEKVGDMTYTRFGHALVNIGGRIIALGGTEWNPDVALKNAEEYDAATKTWTNIGDVMSTPRAHFGYALIPHSAIPGCTIH